MSISWSHQQQEAAWSVYTLSSADASPCTQTLCSGVQSADHRPWGPCAPPGAAVIMTLTFPTVLATVWIH